MWENTIKSCLWCAGILFVGYTVYYFLSRPPSVVQTPVQPLKLTKEQLWNEGRDFKNAVNKHIYENEGQEDWTNRPRDMRSAQQKKIKEQEKKIEECRSWHKGCRSWYKGWHDLKPEKRFKKFWKEQLCETGPDQKEQVRGHCEVTFEEFFKPKHAYSDFRKKRCQEHFRNRDKCNTTPYCSWNIDKGGRHAPNEEFEEGKSRICHVRAEEAKKECARLTDVSDDWDAWEKNKDFRECMNGKMFANREDGLGLYRSNSFYGKSYFIKPRNDKVVEVLKHGDLNRLKPNEICSNLGSKSPVDKSKIRKSMQEWYEKNYDDNGEKKR